MSIQQQPGRLVVLGFLLGIMQAVTGLTVAAADSWQVTLSSLWGDGSKQEFKAVAMDNHGRAYVAVSPYRSFPHLEEWTVGNGSAMIVVIDSRLGSAVSTIRLSSMPESMAWSAHDRLLVSGGQSMALDLEQQQVVWTSSSSGRRILCDAEGGAWVFTGSSAIHLDDKGAQLRSLSISGRDFAVDPRGKRVFTCGHNSGRSTIKQRNPVHVPWVRAFDYDGNRIWQMWGFTPTQVDEVGDMADSHPQRLFFSPNGHLYMFGDSDGGNTPYRHSPHTPGGKFTNGELSGTAFTQMWRAFRSVRMLFVARIDPANGDVLRGSFFYGMWYNEEANRQEIGDAQALGLSVDKDDRVYLTGIMRCNIPFTENAVHKQSAPIDRRGYWNNHVATDEAYLAILDRNFTRLAFASGFNQQGSPDAWSRGLAVAAGGNGAVMVGTVRSRPEHPVSHRVFLRGALQDSWGGDQDGLLVTLHRGLIDHDIMKHTREVFALQLPGESEGRKALLEARALPAALAQLQEQSEPQLARYQAAVEHSGKISLSRAMSYLAHNPFITQQSLQGIVRLWDGSVIAEQAKKALDEINKDPEIRETLAVGRARSAAMEILSGLVEVPQAEQASLLDRNYARRNGRILQRFQQAVMAVYKTWPEHAFTKELLSVASSFAVPITDQDHHMLKYYGQLMQLQDRLRAPGGVPADAENDHFRRLNDNVLKEMRQLIRTMQREDRRHPFTLGGENLAARLNLSLN